MNQQVEKKVQVLMRKAKENKHYKKGKEGKKKQSQLPNSLADQLKTEDQAKSFLILLDAL